MTDSKISALTDGSPAQTTDEIPVARAGTNVRITAADIAALHNDAVDSVNGQTGTVVLGAADVGAADLAFKTIAVSGQSDIVADSTSDTLTLAAGSNITITTNAGTDTVTIAASGSSTPSDFQPAIVTGNYYFSPLISALSSNVLTADSLIAFPFYFSHTETWTRIGFNLQVASGSATEKIRIGIYENGADNLPSTLVFDSGEVSLNATGEVEVTISQSLTANTLYWFAVLTNDPGVTTTVDTMSNSAALPIAPWFFGQSAFNPDIAGPAVSKAQAYGALPASFGTPNDSGGAMPLIWLRKV